jgi:hypothetical protein
MGEYNSLALIAAKTDIPVLVCIDNYTKSQQEFIQKNNIDDINIIGEDIGEFKITNVLADKTFMSTIALILLLIIIAYRGIKS